MKSIAIFVTTIESENRWLGDLGAVATLWSLTVTQVVAITTSTASIDMGWSTWPCYYIAHAQKRQFLRFSSLATLEVVKIITSSTDGNSTCSFITERTFSFRCIATEQLLNAFPYTNIHLIHLQLDECTEFSCYDITNLSFNVFFDYACEKNKWNHLITEAARCSWWLLCSCWIQLWLSLSKLEVQPVAAVTVFFFIPKTVTVPLAIYDTVFFHALFHSTHIPLFTVLDPLPEFTYHLLSSCRKFVLCIQSLLCMLFLFAWPPCQRSEMILMGVSQRAYDMINYISGIYGYLYVCEINVNLIWYLYLFMLNKFCLSESE